ATGHPGPPIPHCRRFHGRAEPPTNTSLSGSAGRDPWRLFRRASKVVVSACHAIVYANFDSNKSPWRVTPEHARVDDSRGITHNTGAKRHDFLVASPFWNLLPAKRHPPPIPEPGTPGTALPTGAHYAGFEPAAIEL